MSVSLYYSAKRERPISPEERAHVAEVLDRYTVAALCDAYAEDREGFNWEGFSLYELESDNPRCDHPASAHKILAGATRLPDNRPDAPAVALAHFAPALTALRRLLPDATWDVSANGKELPWDPQAGYQVTPEILQSVYNHFHGKWGDGPSSRASS